MAFEIVTRDRWGSKSKWKFGDMKLPATAVYLHHSVTAVTDFPYQDAKKVEAEGIARFGQLSYSYLVHPSGVILEGAGTKVGAHTKGNNSTSFGIVLIGDYDDGAGADVWLVPTAEQIEAVRWLVYHLKVEKNWLLDSAILKTHQSVVATACPGNKTIPLLSEFRKAWDPTPPPPPLPPPLVVGPIQEINMLLAHVTLNLRLDDKGNGWYKVPYTIDKIVSITPHSGTRPGVDGAYDGVPDQVGMTPDEGGTIVVIRGGNPGGISPVWMKVDMTPAPVLLAAEAEYEDADEVDHCD